MPLKGINKSFINQDDKKKGLPQLKKWREYPLVGFVWFNEVLI
jgi:hypothetical protein